MWYQARTCSEVGKSAGSCVPMSSSKEYYVPGGHCYCDSMCTTYNDCCDDVSASILSYRKFIMIHYQPRAHIYCIHL